MYPSTTPREFCCRMKNFALIPVILPETKIISATQTTAKTVRTKEVTSIETNTATMETSAEKDMGIAMDSIWRRVSVSLVNRDITSP